MKKIVIEHLAFSTEWVQIAQKTFQFLLVDYHFLITSSNKFIDRYDGYIGYALPEHVLFDISGSSAHTIDLRIYKFPKGQIQGWSYDLYTIVDWFHPNTISSLEARNKAASWRYLSPQNAEKMFEYWAKLLRKYCSPLLEGKFSDWDELQIATQKKIDNYFDKR